MPAIVIIMAVIVGVSGEQQEGEKRIINGLDAKPGQFPFQISLLLLEEHWCGGSILNPTWVLSAAHCATHPTKFYTVLAGTLLRSGEGERRAVRSIIIHDDPKEHDLSLLKVAKPFRFNKLINAVKLPKPFQETAVSTEVITLGWGMDKNKIYPDHLKYVKILTTSYKTCQKGFKTIVYEHNICAGLLEGGKGSCNGDSGGPLVLKDTQIGVVAWGSSKCATLPSPLGVYSQVSYYVDWIQDTIQG